MQLFVTKCFTKEDDREKIRETDTIWPLGVYFKPPLEHAGALDVVFSKGFEVWPHGVNVRLCLSFLSDVLLQPCQMSSSYLKVLKVN